MADQGSDDGKFARTIFQRRRREALEQIYEPRKPAAFVTDRDALCDFARDKLGDAALTYLEFGVKGGKSMTRMLQRFTHPHAKFVGFDSFEGLPEEWKHLQAGMFSTGGKVPGHRDPRVRYVRGWFQNSLAPYLAEHDLTTADPLLVNFDADLYGSTLFVLTQLWAKTEAYYFYFDEFMEDEVIALYDFTRAYPVEFEFYAQTTTSPYKQVFGHMRRVTFAPLALEQA